MAWGGRRPSAGRKQNSGERDLVILAAYSSIRSELEAKAVEKAKTAYFNRLACPEVEALYSKVQSNFASMNTWTAAQRSAALDTTRDSSERDVFEDNHSLIHAKASGPNTRLPDPLFDETQRLALGSKRSLTGGHHIPPPPRIYAQRAAIFAEVERRLCGDSRWRVSARIIERVVKAWERGQTD